MNAASYPPAAHVADLLPAYVNGTLDQDGRGRVHAHLPSCAACRADLAEWQAVAAAATAAFAPASAAMSDEFARVWQAVDQTGATGQPRGSGGAPFAGHRAPARDGQRLEDAMDTYASAWPSRRTTRDGRHWRLGSAPRRWMIAELAAVALLLLTLGAGFLAFGKLRPGAGDHRTFVAAPGAMADHPLVGSWLVSGVSQISYPEAASVFSPDGAVTHIVFSDISPHLPIGNAVGRWAPTGERSATFTLVTVVPDGTVTLRAEVTIDASGDNFMGTYDVVTRAPNGTKLVVDGPNSLRASRIKVERMGS